MVAAWNQSRAAGNDPEYERPAKRNAENADGRGITRTSFTALFRVHQRPSAFKKGKLFLRNSWSPFDIIEDAATAEIAGN